MALTSGAGRAFFSLFGTPFEELEEKDAASKRPLSMENQIVTDEKGRRRFHGAFTGGFSAGYFNSVGTKEGWAPSTFKSSRAQREDLQKHRPEDFMDTEDFSEYGIAPRRIQTTHTFREDTASSSNAEKRRFAGEVTADLESMADRLSDLVKPVDDSIGVNLMRMMGWRTGKGVGAAESALIRERRAKGVIKSYGCELPPGVNESVAESVEMEELETMAPGFQFAPSDVEFIKFEPKSDLHGLGYTGLDVERHLKSKESLQKASSLKTDKSQKKGIKGQAFGVGAFEDDDEDVYGAEDLSNYDYALGGGDVKEKQASVSGDFIPASKSQPPRTFFAPPKLPRDYTPSVPSSSKEKGISKSEWDKKSEPVANSKQDKVKNTVERARALDESHSVWSLVSEKDRERIERIKAGEVQPKMERAGWKRNEKGREVEERRDAKKEVVPFTNDPKKRARFQDFVNYLKRGLFPPQPPDLTEWDWEMEQTEFRKLIPSELADAEVDVRARQKPLAGAHIAATFSLGFKSKFTKGDFGDETQVSGKNCEDEDKIKAVQLKMFGAMTREKHEWHPDRNLCKRFNVPNPFPESRTVGIPYFKKEAKPGLYSLNFDAVAPTASTRVEEDTIVEKTMQVKGEMESSVITIKEDHSAISTTKPIEDEPPRPPMSLFKAIFAQTSSSSSESDEDANGEVREASTSKYGTEGNGGSVEVEETGRTHAQQQGPSAMAPVDYAVEVKVEREEDDVEMVRASSAVDIGSYGPTLPPETTSPGLPPTSVIRLHKRDKKKSRHHRSHKKKKSHDREKSRKRKKEKKKRRRSSSHSDSGTRSEDESGTDDR